MLGNIVIALGFATVFVLGIAIIVIAWREY
jgi:hypothetical protein